MYLFLLLLLFSCFFFLFSHQNVSVDGNFFISSNCHLLNSSSQCVSSFYWLCMSVYELVSQVIESSEGRKVSEVKGKWFDSIRKKEEEEEIEKDRATHTNKRTH